MYKIIFVSIALFLLAAPAWATNPTPFLPITSPPTMSSPAPSDPMTGNIYNAPFLITDGREHYADVTDSHEVLVKINSGTVTATPSGVQTTKTEAYDTFEISTHTAPFGVDATISIALATTYQRRGRIINNGTNEIRYNIGAAASATTIRVAAGAQDDFDYPTNNVHVFGVIDTNSVTLYIRGKE